MKKLMFVFFAMCTILFSCSASAATITENSPIFWYGQQGDSVKMFAGCLHFDGSGDNCIQTVTFINNNFDENTYITVHYWKTGVNTLLDDSGNPMLNYETGKPLVQSYCYDLGSSCVYGNNSQTISCPDGTNKICFYGTTGQQKYNNPMPWSYVSQGMDSNGNIYTLPVPALMH